jgi:hypothetical protein
MVRQIWRIKKIILTDSLFSLSRNFIRKEVVVQIKFKKNTLDLKKNGIQKNSFWQRLQLFVKRFLLTKVHSLISDFVHWRFDAKLYLYRLNLFIFGLDIYGIWFIDSEDCRRIKILLEK